MRIFALVLAISALVACGGSTTYDPNGTGGGGGPPRGGNQGGASGSSGSGSSAGSGGGTGTGGSTATSAPGSGDFQSGFTTFTGSIGRILSAGPSSFTAVIVDQSVPQASLCDGDVLDGLTGNPQAFFLSLKVYGVPDGGIPLGTYTLGGTNFDADLTYAAGLGGSDPNYGPLMPAGAGTANSITVGLFDGHHLQASVEGELQLFDGGGPYEFTSDLDAYDCH